MWTKFPKKNLPADQINRENFSQPIWLTRKFPGYNPEKNTVVPVSNSGDTISKINISCLAQGVDFCSSALLSEEQDLRKPSNRVQNQQFSPNTNNKLQKRTQTKTEGRAVTVGRRNRRPAILFLSSHRSPHRSRRCEIHRLNDARSASFQTNDVSYNPGRG